MKITLNGQIIDIKVTGRGDSRASKQQTMYFLNDLASLYADRARLCEILHEKHPDRTFYTGEHGVIRQANDKFLEIYDQLDAMGLYRDR